MTSELSILMSPLAGDTNRMETNITKIASMIPLTRPHSLGTLIEWKLLTKTAPKFIRESPLAGDTNRMETFLKFSAWIEVCKGPHSLGTLIEWKLNQ